MMLMNIVIAIAPSSSSVVAAFLLFGFWNAGTPLLIASTPVSAAQPDEKARSEQEDDARPRQPVVDVVLGRDVELRALRHRAGRRTGSGQSPTTTITMMRDHEQVRRDGERRARLLGRRAGSSPCRSTTSADATATSCPSSQGNADAAFCTPEEIDTATVST